MFSFGNFKGVVTLEAPAIYKPVPLARDSPSPRHYHNVSWKRGNDRKRHRGKKRNHDINQRFKVSRSGSEGSSGQTVIELATRSHRFVRFSSWAHATFSMSEMLSPHILTKLHRRSHSKRADSVVCSHSLTQGRREDSTPERAS